MWSIALLINTSTWFEFKHNWHLICIVFLKLYLGEDNYDSGAQDALLGKISTIKSDSNTVDAIRSSEVVQDEDATKRTNHHLYDFDGGREADNDDEIDRIFSRVTKQKVNDPY